LFARAAKQEETGGLLTSEKLNNFFALDWNVQIIQLGFLACTG